MKITLPRIVKYSICDIGNKTMQSNALKIYAALCSRDERKNSDGYFEAPSTYLKSINLRYYKIIDKFIEDGIIDYYKRAIQDEDDIFTTNVKKYYNKNLGICMKYKFLIDITKGDTIEVDMDNNRTKNWHKILTRSLTSLGYTNIKISRDSFGRRVHHNLTQTYKKELANKGYSVIDAKCSQPRILYLLMKSKNVIDEKYNNIFDNNLDFYNEVVEILNLNDRQQAKDLFMYWLNSEGYVPNYNIHNLFPVVSRYIRQLKNKNYKDSCSLLQREEAKIWIDDLLNNLPVDFGLTIHDSLVVKDRDILKVLRYCKEKYPLIEFEVKEL